MLINFIINNWMSFHDETNFSMVASKERQYGSRLVSLKKYQTRILPIASIYGGNASGKTNLFKALEFIQKFITKGTEMDSLIAVVPFKLNKSSSNSATSFEIELLIEGLIYCLSFTLDKDKVLSETLTVINSSSEKQLYQRNEEMIKFHTSLQKDQFLQFAFQGTRPNQLFLTNACQQNVENFLPIYNWFRKKLRLISPNSRFEGFSALFKTNHDIIKKIQETIKKLDTGIDHFDMEEVAFDTLPLPIKLKEELHRKLKEGETARVSDRNNRERFLFERKAGEIVAQKVVTYHKDSSDNDIKFEIAQESDGSLRVMDLLPAFLQLSEVDADCVYIIDELDRSLHSKLTRELIRMYLNSCNNESRTQLIFTTHDLQLLDQKLFRRDEMWVTERDRCTGSSSLTAFSDYKDVRYDKDLRKSYLQGRLGGIPNLKVMESENDYGAKN